MGSDNLDQPIETATPEAKPSLIDHKKKRRGGFYWITDKPLLSVTEILKIFDKPALRYWFGQEVYWAMVKDPTLGMQAALAAPYEKTKSAQSRGITVHSIVEAYKHTQEQLDVVEEFRPYAKAFYKFVMDRNMVFVSQERTVISKKYNYAGTLDLLAAIDKNPTPIVIDVKTGKDIYEESFIQTAAYKNGLTEEGITIRGNGTLLLKDNGEYKFELEVEPESYAYRFKGFLAAKTAYEGKNYNMLKKIGYL